MPGAGAAAGARCRRGAGWLWGAARGSGHCAGCARAPRDGCASGMGAEIPSSTVRGDGGDGDGGSGGVFARGRLVLGEGLQGLRQHQHIGHVALLGSVWGEDMSDPWHVRGAGAGGLLAGGSWG